MKITFTSLDESHFPLLLEWLEEPHVKAWWDPHIKWTPELISAKYTDYVKGYKQENDIHKKIAAYIICIDEVPIGYIQIYNAYDFVRSKPLIDLPLNLGAFDVFIGEKSYLKKNIGSKAITQFLKEYNHPYTHIFVDLENTNVAAIKAYEKVGFKRIVNQPDIDKIWMIFETNYYILFK